MKINGKDIKMYNKKDIIKMSQLIDYESDGLESNERRLEKWLDKILKLLNSERLKMVIDYDELGLNGNHLPNKEANARNGKDSIAVYQYNIITAILLALLLRTYEHPYFQELLKENYVCIDQDYDWIEELEKEVKVFRIVWMRETRNMCWGTVRTYIISQLYRLTFLEINNESIEKMDKHIKEIVLKFLLMPPEPKIEAYKKIKTRLEYIDKSLDSIVNDMEYEDKMEYNYNIKPKTNKTMKEFMEDNYNE